LKFTDTITYCTCVCIAYKKLHYRMLSDTTIRLCCAQSSQVFRIWGWKVTCSRDNTRTSL